MNHNDKNNRYNSIYSYRCFLFITINNMVNKMKVYELKNRPMIRIVRESLTKYGFNIGDKYDIKITKNKIVIRRENVFR